MPDCPFCDARPASWPALAAHLAGRHRGAAVAGCGPLSVRRPKPPELPYVVCWCGGAFARDPAAHFHTFADHLQAEGGAVAHVLALTLGVHLP